MQHLKHVFSISVKYGTRHVLVLADFPLSTKTTDLEKLLENFKDRGFVIRWVNDTVALAVFRTPSIGINIFTNFVGFELIIISQKFLL